MDVNEEIVKQWLHLCKNRFTLENISFKTIGEKGGSNYSNIDILACDSEGNFFDYEIKWRSVYSLNASNKKEIDGFINQMFRKERILKIKEIIGEKSYIKVFITTKNFFGSSNQKRNILEEAFKNREVEIKYFEDIIIELLKKIPLKGRFDNETLQIIRIFKLFKLLKDDTTI